MNQLFRPFILFLFYLLAYPTSSTAQFSLEELKRMGRMRPSTPFDLSGDYQLMEALKLRKQGDSTASQPSPWYYDALLGKMIPLGHKWSLGVDGAVNTFLGYNEVEGATLGYEVFLARELGLGRRLVLRSANNFTTTTKQYLGNHRALLFYAPRRSGQAVLDLGITSGNTTHISNDEAFAENFLSNLGTNSHLYDYRKHYLGLRNSLYLTPQLRSDVLALYEYRRPQLSGISPEHQLLLTELRLSYDFARPRPQDALYPTAYQLPHGFFAPEVALMYRLAFDPTRGKAHTPFHSYEVLGLSLRTAYAFGDYQRLEMGLVAESFLSQRRVASYDALSLPLSAFADRLPLSTSWATGEHIRLQSGSWLWGFANYGGGRIALAHIPLLKRLYIDEQIHLKALYTSQSQAWVELAYSLGLGKMLRLGIAWGSDLKHHNVLALRLSLPLLYLTSQCSTRY